MAASDAAAIPLPSEDTTPPVTKMSGVAEPEDVMGAAWLETRILAAGGCDGDRRGGNRAGSRAGGRVPGRTARSRATVLPPATVIRDNRRPPSPATVNEFPLQRRRHRSPLRSGSGQAP